jgi:valyl-tRNA synthetase
MLERSPDYRRFHPTTVMETGYDILFFWVARMVLMTTYVTRDVPFEYVYLHGLVLDKNGDKMSKSKPDLCIDPLDVIREKGADTLRLALVTGNSAGTDARMSDEKIKGASRFINKLWNAAKFVAANASLDDAGPGLPSHPVNRWMHAGLNRMVSEITAALDRFSFGDAADVLRNAFWTGFCDFYIEAAKTPALAAEPETRRLLAHALDTYLRLFHPFIPFVTEDIWERIGGKGFLMHQSWPIAEESDEATAQSVEVLIRAVTAIRNWRVKQNLKWNVAVGVRLRIGAARDVFERCAPVFQQLASVRTVEFVDGDLGADAIEDQAFALTVKLSPENITISPQSFKDA